MKGSSVDAWTCGVMAFASWMASFRALASSCFLRAAALAFALSNVQGRRASGSVRRRTGGASIMVRASSREESASSEQITGFGWIVQNASVQLAL